MRTLIIEAGSSKTDSILMDGKDIVHQIHKSPGINPITDLHYEAAIDESITPYLSYLPIDDIRYYGAGCIDNITNNKIADSLKNILGSNIITEVQDDLLAVARGLCQRSPGIVVILGTGSNTGYFDGSSITDGYKSCGYLLGDEGSGYRLGQELIKRYARGLLDMDSQQMIASKTGVSAEEVIRYIYESENPRTLVASYAAYLKSCHRQTNEDICLGVFEPLANQILKPLYSKYRVPIHLSGSIAFHFKDELLETLKRSDILVTSIVDSPLEGLISYHSI